MNWLRISILTSPEGMEIVTGFLDAHGLHQTEWVESAAQVQSFLDTCHSEWDYVDASVLLNQPPCVRAYVHDDDSGRALLQTLGNALPRLREAAGKIDLGPLELVADTLREEDWANNWKQYFHPFELGQRLYIRPPWEKSPAPKPRIPLTIDPGMLFGTGSHPTTQLCLVTLEQSITPGMRILDAGCGSGILSIAALLLGAKEVTGVDIDPYVRETVLANAQHNDIDASKMDIIVGNILLDASLQQKLAQNPYDLIVANIVADVILPLIPLTPSLLREGGTLLVSGIIDEREREVEQALQTHGFSCIHCERQEDWRLYRAIYT